MGLQRARSDECSLRSYGCCRYWCWQFHSLARESDGTFIGWGNNGYDQITFPAGLAEVVAFDVGQNHNLAIKTDGTVIGWGYNVYHQIDIPVGLTDVVAVAAGGNHSLALKSDGTVVAWGENSYGQSRSPSTLTGAVAIYAGYWHSLAVVPADSPLNTAPVANPGGSYLGIVNTSINFDGSLSSNLENDPLTFAWNFGDGTTGSGVSPTHSYTDTGVYDVCLTVNDGTIDSAPACTLAVVYDPSAGFVTGGGWINSPAGAYKANESLTGKATFGFISKYKKGASVPTGNTAFEFDLAGLVFSSENYEWLVVNKIGTKAQFKGNGLINGTAGTNGKAYKFILWAGDSSPDTFRIRIWWEDEVGEHVVYDNGAAQAIEGGSIVVHTGK